MFIRASTAPVTNAIGLGGPERGSCGGHNDSQNTGDKQ
jgi:hypothetical protein